MPDGLEGLILADDAFEPQEGAGSEPDLCNSTRNVSMPGRAFLWCRPCCWRWRAPRRRAPALVDAVLAWNVTGFEATKPVAVVPQLDHLCFLFDDALASLGNALVHVLKLFAVPHHDFASKTSERRRLAEPALELAMPAVIEGRGMRGRSHNGDAYASVPRTWRL